MEDADQDLLVDVIVGEPTEKERRDDRADRDGAVDPADLLAGESAGVEEVPQNDEPGAPNRELQKMQQAIFLLSPPGKRPVRRSSIHV